ncbi:MAG: peptidylprolyl isomerase [Mizugakiibacter sp.]|uniref:FKBP-type peptidyl-prolyl cis-trans isomerase n=1 Tax=Mizugakiibacter sp. TaxID=1972610 RepID=UPI0031CBCE8C|nr:peptidylprolyl isomerase [Xanthomonadaceae bacterium]
MKAEKDKVVSFHYTVTDADGTAVDSSRERGEPLTVLLGHGQLIPGVEKAIDGREAGDKFQVSVQPEEGYGARREGMIQRVPKKYFRDAKHLKPGVTTVLALKEGGQRAVTVHKVGMSTVDVDLNHPLAGKTLGFDVEVTAVRDATAEEIAHGHAHGPDGHAHA